MRSTVTMRAVLGALLILATLPATAAPAAPASAAAPTSYGSALKGLVSLPGFVDVHRDAARNRVLIGVAAFDSPFLMYSSLPWGLGSNDVGLDRGQVGEGKLVEFRRAGNRVLLVQRNTRFTASAPVAAEQRSVQEAFAESVLWAGEVIAERPATASGGARVLVDFTGYLTGDRHGISRSLDDAKQGKYALDGGRSLVLPELAKSFPDNAEFEALLTFSGSGPARDAPQFVRDAAVDAESLTLRQHLSLVRAPAPGYQPRAYHPWSGGISQSVYDFSQPLAASLDQRVQIRHRLERVDPRAARGPVKKPIVYYLDPGTPEPVRSALLDGARWWARAFAAAGFDDAYRVEMLPPDADPMDVRYHVIVWAHRATRGWSYGNPLIDPRTGEIIKGVVTLGSQRVRQDILIAEALTAPYAPDAPPGGVDAAREMALARLRQLAAHEVGHTLGFEHNFAASWQGNGSVMDYPHPAFALKDGRVDLSQAYGVGVGPWDEFLVKHAYQQFAPGEEAAGLAALRAAARAAGLVYVGDPDSRAPSSAHPDGQLWDYGADPLATFDTLLAVRATALARFSAGVLPPEREAGELEARLVPVYLLHRYQVDAVSRLIGGARYEYALAGEGRAGTTPVPAATQRAALRKLMRALSVETLALPASVLDLLTPPSHGYARSREHFATKAGPTFDAVAAVGAGTMVTASYLFNPARLNRLQWQHARDAGLPGLGEVLDAVFAATWQRTPPKGVAAGGAVRDAIAWTVLDALIATLDGSGLEPTTAAELRGALAGWQRWLDRNAMDDPDRRAAADWLARYLADPATAPRRALPYVPPGAPI
jgi:hypothetical protein